MDLLHKIPKLRWLPVRHWYDLRRLMRLNARVRDPRDGLVYRFRCDSFQSYQRARTFLAKEPDTIEWIDSHLRPDDIFLDIGANIGIFTLYVAKRLSAAGQVYACEPHLPSATQLLQNVAANGLGDRVSVLSIAASGEDGFTPFLYRRWREGASGSQLNVTGGPGLANPAGIELKYGLTVDTMIEQGVIRPPNLVKIDTDGIELPIVRGMAKLLGSPQRPRSMLVEVQKGEFQAQKAQMEGFGYRLTGTQAAGRWLRLQQRGASLDDIAFNAFFEPA